MYICIYIYIYIFMYIQQNNQLLSSNFKSHAKLF